MKKNEKVSGFISFEMRIYEILGVTYFRKAVLLFEKIKHYKDGGFNENYHLKSFSLSSLKSFSGYLLYNSMFHVISLLLVLVCFLTVRLNDQNYLWVDILIYALTVFNLYCIMLQRYIYLNIKRLVIRIQSKRKDIEEKCFDILSSVLEKKNRKELEEEYALLCELSHNSKNGRDCVLGSEKSEILNRLADVAEHIDILRESKPKDANKDITFENALLRLENKTHLRGQKERWVSKLQRLLGCDKRQNISFGCSVVTETVECENAFCRLFPIRTRDNIDLILAVLMFAYQKKGTAVG